jgi:hypothetical protein
MKEAAMARGYVVLDRAWARRLGVRRSSAGIYRIARWELMERLKQLQQDRMKRVVSLSAREDSRDLTESEPPLDDIVAVESHPHFVEFYKTEAFLVDCVRDFLTVGVVTRGAVIVVATQAHQSMFEHALWEAGIDISETQHSGRFVTLDASEALARFMVDGMPDPPRFKATIGELVSRAVQTGRDVRIYGEMVAVLWEEGNVAAAIALEDLWNELATRYPFSLFCAYPIHVLDAEANTPGCRTICGQHSKAILQGQGT